MEVGKVYKRKEWDSYEFVVSRMITDEMVYVISHERRKDKLRFIDGELRRPVYDEGYGRIDESSFKEYEEVTYDEAIEMFEDSKHELGYAPYTFEVGRFYLSVPDSDVLMFVQDRAWDGKDWLYICQELREKEYKDRNSISSRDVVSTFTVSKNQMGSWYLGYNPA